MTFFLHVLKLAGARSTVVSLPKPRHFHSLSRFRTNRHHAGHQGVNVLMGFQDFYLNTPALHELGFTCTEGVLCQPFSLDAAQLAEAYPDLRKPMLQFEKVFDKLLKANEHIDKLILGMVPAAAKTAE